MSIVSITQTQLDSLITAINNRAKSADVSTSLAGKQNVLTAGANISIVGDVISANDTSVAWSEIASKPTTLAGYGITDAALSTHNHTLDSLSNTTITSNTIGEILKWNGTAWVNNTLAEAGISATSHNHTLDSLSNTTINTAVNGHFLVWNGTAWANRVIAAGDVPALDASKITTGTLTVGTSGNAATATKLATARTLSLTGDATGSATFDGSANASISVVIADDSHAHSFANLTSKPTTLAGYGITDAATSTHNHTLDSLSNTSITANTAGEILKWNGTAWVNNTLAEAGITPVAHVGSNGDAHAVASTTVNGFMSAADKVKLDGVAAGAQANQNAFSNIAVNGQTTVAADLATDTLTFVAGTNVSITTDAVNDTITISANDTSVDWTEIQNKPDPTITLAGDATGSVTLTDVGSGTLTVTVVDDSHNHVISNVDGLQTALDGKQPLDATLTALAGVTTSADKYIYATAADAFTTGTITSFGRSLVDDADAATARGTLGVAGAEKISTAAVTSVTFNADGTLTIVTP